MSIQRRMLWSLAIAGLVCLPGCGEDSATDISQSKALPELPAINLELEAALPVADQLPADDTMSAMVGASEIPYTVYPNGAQYRVGGENGLKIVVFETEDSFEQVDEFYRNLSTQDHMPRLHAMSDYVRYSSSTDDKDPWATYRPGIVIHKFNDDTERMAVGANKKARTNIIMSF